MTEYTKYKNYHIYLVSGYLSIGETRCHDLHFVIAISSDKPYLQTDVSNEFVKTAKRELANDSFKNVSIIKMQCIGFVDIPTEITFASENDTRLKKVQKDLIDANNEILNLKSKQEVQRLELYTDLNATIKKLREDKQILHQLTLDLEAKLHEKREME